MRKRAAPVVASRPARQEGKPLTPAVRARYESLLDADLAEVRVHLDEPAVAAQAMTVGADVYLAAGEYQPGIPEGDRVLAHELAHVVQQRGGTGGGRHGTEESAESEAEAAATRMVNGYPAGPLGAFDAGTPQFRAPLEIRSQAFRPQLHPLTRGYEGTYHVELDWNGDRFDVDVAREYIKGVGAAGVIRANLSTDVRYAGPHMTDRRSYEFSRIHPGVTQLEPISPRVQAVSDTDTDRLKESRLVVDPTGKGATPFEVSLRTTINPDWVPPLRTHDVRGNMQGPRVAGDVDPFWTFHVREQGAVPAATAKDLDDVKKLPKPDVSGLTTLQLLHLAEQRLHEVRPGAWMPGAPPAGTGWHGIVTTEVRSVARRYEAAKEKQPDEESVRRKAADLARVAGQAAPALVDLGKALDERAYAGGTAKQAKRLVSEAIASTVTSIAFAFADQPDRLADLEHRALRDRVALPYDLAGLYLKANLGVEAVQNEVLSLSSDLYFWRTKADLGASRSIDSILGVRYFPGSGSTSMSRGQQQRQLEVARTAFYTGAQDVYAQLTDITQQTQREAGLFSLFALYAQMTWFREELDSWLDTAVGVMPGTMDRQRPVAQKWKDRFGALLAEVEGAWTGSWTPAFVTKADDVTKRFVNWVDAAKSGEFAADVATIQSRLSSIEVIKAVAKVLAIVAVASLAAWAAGAGIGALLTSAGRGLSLAPALTTAMSGGGAFLAEVTAFTVVSRVGNEAFLGGNKTSFLEDWGTNFLMFRLLRFTSGLYAARWTQLARLARPATYAAGHAAVSAVTLHAFAEIHHLLKNHKPMSGEERFLAIFNNLVMVTTFSLGSYIATKPESRLPAPVWDYVLKNYGSRFKVLEGRRNKITDELAKLKKDPSSVDLADLLAQLEYLYNIELSLIARAAGKGGLKAEQVKAALDAYAKPMRALEIEFARMGMTFGTEQASMFRPLGGQLVEFRPDGLTFLQDHYAAAKGELVPVGEGMYRGTIKGEVTYWIARGKGLPQGGMRGPEVLPLAETDVLTAREVPRLRGLLRRLGLANQLRHQAQFDPPPTDGYSTMRVPLDGGLTAEVLVSITLRTPTERAAHGLETGHARNTLTFDAGRWRADIEIDPRLRAEDADLGAIHEANEVAGIVRRLNGRAVAGEAVDKAILEQQQSALTREGARGREPTEHDIATAADLVTLWKRYQADQSPINRQTLDRQIRAMGFGDRYFAQELAPKPPGSTRPDRSYNLSEHTRSELVRSVAPAGVSTPLLEYVDAWRTATFEQTVFRPADRPSVAARLREYTDALANRVIRSGPFRQPTATATMDLLERVARAAKDRVRLTVADLEHEGVPSLVATRIVNDMPTPNPYRTLYAEMESMIALRHRVEAARAAGQVLGTSVGYGFARDLGAVRMMTRGGRLDGLRFTKILERLQHAQDRGLLAGDPADPLRPQFDEPANAASAVRLTWKFRSSAGGPVDSLFSIDLPGVVAGRPFQLGDMVHADLEPVKASGGHATEHVTETGVVVPAGSAPAHIYIVPDAAFATFVDGLGLRDQRIRLERGAPR